MLAEMMYVSLIKNMLKSLIKKNKKQDNIIYWIDLLELLNAPLLQNWFSFVSVYILLCLCCGAGKWTGHWWCLGKSWYDSVTHDVKSLPVPRGCRGLGIYGEGSGRGQLANPCVHRKCLL